MGGFFSVLTTVMVVHAAVVAVHYYHTPARHVLFIYKATSSTYGNVDYATPMRLLLLSAAAAVCVSNVLPLLPPPPPPPSSFFSVSWLALVW